MPPPACRDEGPEGGASGGRDDETSRRKVKVHQRRDEY
jgi:hypothetical protein